MAAQALIIDISTVVAALATSANYSTVIPLSKNNEFLPVLYVGSNTICFEAVSQLSSHDRCFNVHEMPGISLSL